MNHEDSAQHMWQRAASLCARAHRHQTRKDGKTPYAAHPNRVALTVALVFGESDETTIAAALLHDVIEDGETDYDEIAEEFGPAVAGAVAALSKDARLPEAEREPADWRARLIKLGDVYDNMSDLASGARTTPDAIRRVVSRADRAIGLARTCGDDRPSVLTAIEHVQALADRWRERMV